MGVMLGSLQSFAASLQLTMDADRWCSNSDAKQGNRWKVWMAGMERMSVIALHPQPLEMLNPYVWKAEEKQACQVIHPELNACQ